MNKIDEVHFLIPETNQPLKDNFFNFYNVLNQYNEFDKKIYIGKDFICRYCGETDTNFFKKDNSHAFPEFTGNKWIISKDECIKCNQLFSLYENELANQGHVMRTLLGLKTKKGASTTYKNRSFRLQKKEKGFLMNLFDKNEFQDSSKKDGGVTFHIDFLEQEESATVKIPQMQFIPFYIVKCLTKIGLAIMPDSEFNENEFDELKKWLVTNNNFPKNQETPFNYVYYMNLPLADRRPMLQLFKKKEEYADFPIPTYSLFFLYGSVMFQTFLPHCKSDKWIKSIVKTPIIPFFVGITKDKKRGFRLINGNVFEKVTSEGYKTFIL